MLRIYLYVYIRVVQQNTEKHFAQRHYAYIRLYIFVPWTRNIKSLWNDSVSLNLFSDVFPLF